MWVFPFFPWYGRHNFVYQRMYLRTRWVLFFSSGCSCDATIHVLPNKTRVTERRQTGLSSSSHPLPSVVALSLGFWQEKVFPHIAVLHSRSHAWISCPGSASSLSLSPLQSASGSRGDNNVSTYSSCSCFRDQRTITDNKTNSQSFFSKSSWTSSCAQDIVTTSSSRINGLPIFI